MRPTTIDAVLERVTPEPNTGCLLWVGGVDYDGYGIAKIRGRSRRVHRLAWERENGPIPPGMEVCHRCDTPGCVLADPDPRRSHLFLGTNRDNMTDRNTKGRHRLCGAKGDAHYNHRLPLSRRVRGERHGRRKLAEAQVREIIARLHAGETQHGLARVFGVSVATVNLIALGRNWAHLPRP